MVTELMNGPYSCSSFIRRNGQVSRLKYFSASRAKPTKIETGTISRQGRRRLGRSQYTRNSISIVTGIAADLKNTTLITAPAPEWANEEYSNICRLAAVNTTDNNMRPPQTKINPILTS